MGTLQNGNYISDYTGAEIDSAILAASNPDTTPTAGSNNLVTSGGVAAAIDDAITAAIGAAIGGSY